MKDLVVFDLKIGFLVKNCIYRQLGMSRIPKYAELKVVVKLFRIFVKVCFLTIGFPEVFGGPEGFKRSERLRGVIST